MKNKTRTVFACLITLLAASIRSFQLLNTIDASTGNVINRYIPLQKYFGIGILACLIAVTVLGIFSKPKTESFTLHSKSMALISAAMACSLMFDGFKLLFNTFKNFTSESVLPLVLFAISIIAALYFVSLSVSMFSSKNIFPNPLLPAFVIICFGLKLVTQYLTTVLNADISEHKFSILMYASFVLFWIFYARYCLKSKKSKRLISLFSILAIFCGTVTLLPRVVATVVPALLPSLYGASSNVFNANEFFVTDVVTIIFAVIFIYYMNRAEKTEEEEDDFIFEGIKGVSNTSDTDEILHNVMGENTLSQEESSENMMTPDTVKALIDEVLPELENADVDQVVFDEEDVIPPPKKPFVVTIAPEEEQTQPDEVEEEEQSAVFEAEETENEERTEEESTDETETEEQTEEESTDETETEEQTEEESTEETENEVFAENSKTDENDKVETTENSDIEQQSEFEETPDLKIEQNQAEEEEIEEQMPKADASTDDIINNLLDEIMGKYGEDN